MGSNALISLLGLIVLMSIMSGNLNKADNTSKDATLGYAKYTIARDLSTSAINLALRSVDNGGGTNISGSLDGGTYTVTGYFSAIDTLNLVSTGTFAESTYTIRARLWRYPKPFPSVGSALGLNIDSVNFDINNNSPKIQIDGHNYDSTGQNLVGYGDVAGVTVVGDYESTKVAPYTAKIDGATDINVDPDLADPSTFVDEYIANADTVFNPSSPIASNLILGTASDPKITYVAGNTDTTKPVTFAGNVLGWGILVIKGSVQFKGTFEWHGLVIVYGSSYLDLSVSSGTPKFYGSVLMGGPSNSTFYLKGTPEFRYSSQTLDKSKYVNKLLAYHIVDWYE